MYMCKLSHLILQPRHCSGLQGGTLLHVLQMCSGRSASVLLYRCFGCKVLGNA